MIANSTPWTLAHIFRHPIKAHGREELASVRLLPGRALPWDRHWAVAHDLSKFDPVLQEWVSCANFQRGARTGSVMAIQSQFDPDQGIMTLTHPLLPTLRFAPETEGARLIEWLLPISPAERFRPVALVRAKDQAMTDSDYPSVSIKNLASHQAVSHHMGKDLSLHRWRGNLWLHGVPAWAEMDWPGRHLRIGATVLEIRERVGRCKATTIDPATGEADGDTLGALRACVGSQDFGVFGVVVEAGEIAPGAKVELIS